MFKVQKAGLTSDEWKTICTNRNEEYAREIYERSLKMYSIGQFRIVDDLDHVIVQAKTKPLFSDN